MSQNIFGTDGIRCSVGTPPLSLEQLPRLGNAIGIWAQKKYGNNPVALIAHDTRISSSFVKAALTSGLLLSPLTLYDAQILPTPALCKIINENALFNFGIVISASHNHYLDNGIKLVDAKTGKLTEENELELSTLFNHTDVKKCTYFNLGTLHAFFDAEEQHIHNLWSYFEPNSFNGITIVLDCAHGATYRIAPDIFKKLGANIIVLNNKPTGTNINNKCGSLFPKTLQKTVTESHADIGFAFDGDGDRVIAVNKYGEVKNGDDILALLSNHSNYYQQKKIVCTIMSNEGLAAYVNNVGKKLIRTKVGDKYVSKKLEQEQLLLGGEQSGHIIMRDYLATGDGIFTALRIVETIMSTDNWAFKTFKKYPQLLINIPITIKKDLTEPKLATIITNYKKKLINGRLEVRYSGTENILRVMIEDTNQSTAQLIGKQISQELKRVLSYP